MTEVDATARRTGDVTLDRSLTGSRAREENIPGIIIIFSGDTPTFQAVPLRDRRLQIGRSAERETQLAIDDPRLSRAHFEVIYEGLHWRIRDLGSRNGTRVDSRLLERELQVRHPACVSAGRTVLVCAADVRPYLDKRVDQFDRRVVGPRLRDAFDKLGRIAEQGDGALIIGESGSGKELAAEYFHARSRRQGPLVAVNCAAVPEGMAERLFFGARKGAYSGAVENAVGYLQAAHGGVLFLDELGEIDLAVQAKLLRVLERREVVPLGAVHPVPVDVQVCAATHCDIRGAVANGAFRADLFYRIGQREVRIPALRERPEEIPFLVSLELAQIEPRLGIHPSFIEACLLRRWHGNIRELRSAVREAADRAITERKPEVRAEHLPAAEAAEPAPRAASSATRPDALSKEDVVAALERNDGNIAKTARALALHRTQLYRLMTSFGLRSAP